MRGPVPKKSTHWMNPEIVVATALIHGDEDCGPGPLLTVALGACDEILDERLEQSPFPTARMPVEVTVRFHVGHRGQSAVSEVREEIGDVPHVLGNHGGIVGFVFKRIADAAVSS